MNVSSCKAKGRRLQDLFRDGLRAIGKPFGLEDGDVESRGMGQNGTDTILSPAANRVFGAVLPNLSSECKNVESLNVVSTFWSHAAKYPNGTPVLVHKKNHTNALVTLRLTDFFTLLNRSLNSAS